MGLDYRKNTPRSVQEEALRAKTHGKSIVIHARSDRDDFDTSVVDRVLEINVELGLQTSNIHLHYFNYSWAVAGRGIMACPNVCFSITAMVLRVSHVAESAGRIPISLLVLESDAPFLLPPPGVRTFQNHHWHLHSVAAHVARLRNVPLKDLERRANTNAC